MSAAEMYDYLNTISADVDYTLNVQPTDIIWEDGDKNVIVHDMDDNSGVLVTLSTDSVFYARLTWRGLSESDSGTIFDIFHNANKACGRGKKIKWSHPWDGHTYVVSFADPLPRSRGTTAVFGIATIRLRVWGRIADS